jgi:ABC-type nitrate/sulfonate/bicarbonate transport system substrate-binding protein
MRIAMNRRHFMGAAAAGAASTMFAGRASAATPFSMQAAWINDAEFAGYFLAIDKGYYAQEGLDLTYLSGGPDVIPESTIIAGRADLALSTPDTTIRAIAEQGAKFKIIGAQYQKNPIGIVSLKKNPINAPKDLIGKTLAVPPVNTSTVAAMFAANGIDITQVIAFTFRQGARDR